MATIRVGDYWMNAPGPSGSRVSSSNPAIQRESRGWVAATFSYLMCPHLFLDGVREGKDDCEAVPESEEPAFLCPVLHSEGDTWRIFPGRQSIYKISPRRAAGRRWPQPVWVAQLARADHFRSLSV